MDIYRLMKGCTRESFLLVMKFWEGLLVQSIQNAFVQPAAAFLLIELSHDLME